MFDPHAALPPTKPRPEMEPLTENEMLHLVTSLLQGSEDGVDEETAQRFIEWCSMALTTVTLVSMCIKGLLAARWSEEQNDFLFRVTDYGRLCYESMNEEDASSFVETCRRLAIGGTDGGPEGGR